MNRPHAKAYTPTENNKHHGKPQQSNPPRKQPKSGPAFMNNIEEAIYNMSLQNKKPMWDYTHGPEPEVQPDIVHQRRRKFPVSRPIVIPPPPLGRPDFYNFMECHRQVSKDIPRIKFSEPHPQEDGKALGYLIASFKCSDWRWCEYSWGGDLVVASICKYDHRLPGKPTTFSYSVTVPIQFCDRCKSPGSMNLDQESYVQAVSGPLVAWKKKMDALEPSLARKPELQDAIVSRPSGLDLAMSRIENALGSLAIQREIVDPSPSLGGSPSIYVPRRPPQGCYNFPEHHTRIVALVPDVAFCLKNAPGDEEAQLKLSGSFQCPNFVCSREWTSNKVILLVRRFSTKSEKPKALEYCALVYNQRCKICNNLGLMEIKDDEYVQQVSRQLKIWKG